MRSSQCCNWSATRLAAWRHNKPKTKKPVCVSGVLEVLIVWRHTKNKAEDKVEKREDQRGGGYWAAVGSNRLTTGPVRGDYGQIFWAQPPPPLNRLMLLLLLPKK